MSKISSPLSRHSTNLHDCCKLTLQTPALWKHGHFTMTPHLGKMLNIYKKQPRALLAGSLTVANQQQCEALGTQKYK